MASSLTIAAQAGRFFPDALVFEGLPAELGLAGFAGDFGCFFPMSIALHLRLYVLFQFEEGHLYQSWLLSPVLP